MSDKTNRLFSHLSATQDFLLAKTDAACSANAGSDADGGKGKKEQIPEVLIENFPDILTGRPFMEHAMDALEDVDLFCICAIRIGTPPQPPETDDSAAVISVARSVDAACRREGGFWGLIDSDLFGCFFPGKTESFHETAATLIRNEMPESNRLPVIIGTAVFPFFSFMKTRILENACKAVDHACFFGPDSTVAFDDVSLNISGDKIFQNGDIPAAIEEYKAGLEINEKNINLRNSLGVCYGLLGRLDLAKQELSTAVRCNHDDLMSLYNLGLVHMMLGDRENALEYFRKAHHLSDDMFEINYQTGRLLLEMGETDKALAYLNRAVELDPDSAQAFRSMGDYHLARNTLDEAVIAFKKAIKLNPNEAAALSALGAVYDMRGENTEIATLYCEKSIQLSPEEGLFYLRLGRLYMKQDRVDEAGRAFKAAADLGQQTPELDQEDTLPQKTG